MLASCKLPWPRKPLTSMRGMPDTSPNCVLLPYCVEEINLRNSPHSHLLSPLCHTLTRLIMVANLHTILPTWVKSGICAISRNFTSRLISLPCPLDPFSSEECRFSHRPPSPLHNWRYIVASAAAAISSYVAPYRLLLLPFVCAGRMVVGCWNRYIFVVLSFLNFSFWSSSPSNVPAEKNFVHTFEAFDPTLLHSIGIPGFWRLLGSLVLYGHKNKERPRMRRFPVNLCIEDEITACSTADFVQMTLLNPGGGTFLV